MWRRKSRSGRTGRPRIPRKNIDFIKRISGHHLEWGEDKIAEELAVKFGIVHSTSTIRRYMVPRLTTPRGDQTRTRNYSNLRLALTMMANRDTYAPTHWDRCHPAQSWMTKRRRTPCPLPQCCHKV